jgi:hypothetical protein
VPFVTVEKAVPRSEFQSSAGEDAPATAGEDASATNTSRVPRSEVQGSAGEDAPATAGVDASATNIRQRYLYPPALRAESD